MCVIDKINLLIKWVIKKKKINSLNNKKALTRRFFCPWFSIQRDPFSEEKGRKWKS